MRLFWRRVNCRMCCRTCSATGPSQWKRRGPIHWQRLLLKQEKSILFFNALVSWPDSTLWRWSLFAKGFFTKLTLFFNFSLKNDFLISNQYWKAQNKRVAEIKFWGNYFFLVDYLKDRGISHTPFKDDKHESKFSEETLFEQYLLLAKKDKGTEVFRRNL